MIQIVQQNVKIIIHANKRDVLIVVLFISINLIIKYAYSHVSNNIYKKYKIICMNVNNSVNIHKK